MFEVNTFSPHQTGVLFTWLVVNRGPCSYVVLNWIVCRDLTAPGRVLVHPNTDDAVRDHTELVTWIGPAWPVNVEVIKKFMKAH